MAPLSQPGGAEPADSLSRVLLVDPDRESAAVLVRTVSQDGAASVTHAGSLEQARRCLDVDTFDLMLVDVALLDPDWLSVQALLRPLPAVVALADTEQELLASRALAAGTQDELLRSEATPRAISRILRYARERAATAAALRGRDEQMLGAQKMEAIGRLAGGVAHDFSNLLTVILGASEHLLDGLPVEHPLWREADSVRTSALRAVSMTRQLLAFSRHQVSEPVVLDLNEVIAGAEPLLRRLIGEDLELVAACSADVGFVRADSSQLEQVLLNLAVNARDAMPSGGRLTIETGSAQVRADAGGLNLAPGRYAVLSVIDTGIGMDAETRARAFEPFFTTKEPGKGTGLGLATVYGIVSNSGGTVQIESTPGAGTSMRVFLPSVAESLTVSPVPAAPVSPMRGGSETVLLVEDEDAVRDLVGDMLQMVGYRVLVASRPTEAVQRCRESEETIDLLLTDVVMPEMNGLELARTVQSLKPAMRVLFMSGYPEHTALAGGSLEQGMQFVAKPFDRKTLLGSVRAALDAAWVNEP